MNGRRPLKALEDQANSTPLSAHERRALVATIQRLRDQLSEEQQLALDDLIAYHESKNRTMYSE